MENRIVTLMEQNGCDVLKFKINDQEIIDININSKDQTELRKLFYSIIQECMRMPFEFELNVEDGYKKNLYIEVSREYIKQLNGELKKIIEEIPDKLK